MGTIRYATLGLWEHQIKKKKRGISNFKEGISPSNETSPIHGDEASGLGLS